MRTRAFVVAGLLFAVASCRSPPPEVRIEGPSEIEAGGEASFQAVLSPPTDNARFSWKAKWSRAASDQRVCEISVRGEDTERVVLKVGADCEGGDIAVSVRVKPRGEAVTAHAVARVRPVEVPVWPNPPPPTWHVLNDYESAAEPRLNRFGAAWGTWGFKGGKCAVEVADGVLKVAYALPMGDSECGTFEYLKGVAGKPEPFDIRSFERVTLMVKSGDGQAHRVSLEVVELDPYAQALQGYVGTTPAWDVGPDWKRYEARLDDILHPRFDRKMAKQVGLRIRRKDQGQTSGVILVDNLTWIEKERAP